MKAITIGILIAIVLIVGAFVVSNVPSRGVNANNVTMENGKQIVSITARGGYSPEKSVAKAGIETIVRFETNGTFDCSLAVRIPSMNYSNVLPRTGTTDINIGIQNVGTFHGSCGMGMYPFEIVFTD